MYASKQSNVSFLYSFRVPDVPVQIKILYKKYANYIGSKHS